ncbi:UNVERIFIED_CONTAM: Alkane hydroxylase MAH1 [Sesamum angustifolium]|uniref:Alkane hydroxylase MAH1 n=1 Tax=Sesamum angustifolium TaxID=2727405 RepID=A0AAW2PF66_9LAMI
MKFYMSTVAIQHKAPVEHDILPTGHRVEPNTITLLSFHSMGRMESIWGKDCLQYKPGRWISETGRIRIEPSYKFTAFNAGPKELFGKGDVLHPNVNRCSSHH